MRGGLGDIHVSQKTQNFGKNGRKTAIFLFFSKFKKMCICIAPEVTLIPNFNKVHEAISNGQTHGQTDKTQSYIPRHAQVRRGIIIIRCIYKATYTNCPKYGKCHILPSGHDDIY